MRLALQSGIDAVFVPAEDGGYVAIGLRRADPSLFTFVRWGTSEVMEETRTRLRNLGWSYRELPAMRDVDVPADLDWLMSDGTLSVEEIGRLRQSRGVGRCGTNALALAPSRAEDGSVA